MRMTSEALTKVRISVQGLGVDRGSTYIVIRGEDVRVSRNSGKNGSVFNSYQHRMGLAKIVN
jgi:hypothetical protein